MHNGLGKREFQRLESQLDVAVEIIPFNEGSRHLPSLSVKSRNISKAGICLETKFIEIDGLNLLSGLPGARENRLHMTIALFPKEAPFQAVGEVCWYDLVRDETGCRYQIGIDFLDIPGDGKNRLDRFLKIHRTTKGFLTNCLDALPVFQAFKAKKLREDALRFPQGLIQ